MKNQTDILKKPQGSPLTQRENVEANQPKRTGYTWHVDIARPGCVRDENALHDEIEKGREDATAEKIAHTPGPWYQYNTNSGKHDPDSHMVCTDSLPRRIFGDKKQFSQPAIIVQTTMYTSVEGEEAAANARLIAAAPELLEALKKVYEWQKRTQNFPISLQAVENAIAKAQGLSPSSATPSCI